MQPFHTEKLVFRKLTEAFKTDVMPIIELAEFEPSIFSSHHFGADGRDAVYTFISLQEPDILDLIYFRISFVGMAIGVFYNRIGLDKDVSDISEFKGKDGLQLLLMPFRSTEKEIHRWRPIPFLKFPKMYAVAKKSSEDAINRSISKVITDLSNDIAYFEIIRSEWNDEHRPITLEISKLK